MGKKAEWYLSATGGQASLAIILDVEYEGLSRARVSLLAADNNDGDGDISAAGVRWEQRGETFHSDDDMEEQHVGSQIGFYLSDFLGSAGLPAAYCRPPAGISRFVSFSFFLVRPRLLIRSSLHRNPQLSVSY